MNIQQIKTNTKDQPFGIKFTVMPDSYFYQSAARENKLEAIKDVFESLTKKYSDDPRDFEILNPEIVVARDDNFLGNVIVPIKMDEKFIEESVKHTVETRKEVLALPAYIENLNQKYGTAISIKLNNFLQMMDNQIPKFKEMFSTIAKTASETEKNVHISIERHIGHNILLRFNNEKPQNGQPVKKGISIEGIPEADGLKRIIQDKIDFVSRV